MTSEIQASEMHADVLTDIATLKAEFNRLDRTTDRLLTTLDKLSANVAELKESLASVKTLLTAAIGVAVFMAGLLAPLAVRSWTAPTPAAAQPANSTEIRDLQRQVDKLQGQIERLLAQK
jgi:prefoldin subunit 5